MIQSLRSVVAALALSVFLFGCMASQPDNLGIRDGRLSPCPDTPNCVSSHSPEEDEEHYIAPLSYELGESMLRQSIVEVLNETPRTEIVTAKDDYFHVRATTRLLRFVDDFELYIDAQKKELHFRSASRVGRSDFGTNRKRIESFRISLQPKLEGASSS